MKSGADNLPDDPVLLKQMLLLAHGKVAQLQEQVALLRHKGLTGDPPKRIMRAVGYVAQLVRARHS